MTAGYGRRAAAAHPCSHVSICNVRLCAQRQAARREAVGERTRLPGGGAHVPVALSPDEASAWWQRRFSAWASSTSSCMCVALREKPRHSRRRAARS